MNDYRNNRREERREAWKQRWEQRQQEAPHNHIWMGGLFLVIGGVALARSFGVIMPVWLYSWQMLLIAVGVFIGLKKGFREGGWFVPILIGGAFLINDYFLNGDLRRHIWPLILVIVGLVFIFRPKGKRFGRDFQKKSPVTGSEPEIITPLSESHYTQDEFIDSTCIFSGTKKVILTKNFRGGDMVTIFGGSEIDLTQADMTEPAVLEITAIFGGATLVVPSNWAIRSEAVTIFAGISDKRRMGILTEPTARTLILKGTMIFGGIDIKSY